MAIPQFSMRELIEAGVHFGHKTKRWNPRMAPFIYGVRNNVHIIDLQKTVPMLHRALQAARQVVSQNGRVLFVGTKRQASDMVAEAAKRCGQYYVNQRWLGGMLTNWGTIQASIKRLRKLEDILGGNVQGFTKKEMLNMERQREKLEKSLGGIKDMGGIPNLLFVIDTKREELAIAEAQRLGIPIIAVVDTNCDVAGIDYPIPGNDDSIRAIKLYCKLISDAVLDGIQVSLDDTVDFKAAEETVVEELPVAKTEAKEAKDEGDGKKAKSTTKRQAFAEQALKAKKAKETPLAEVASQTTEGVASAEGEPKKKRSRSKKDAAA